MISKEQLEQELAGLRAQEAQHLSSLQAVHGAIQLCEALIHKAAQPEVKIGPELVPDTAAQ